LLSYNPKLQVVQSEREVRLRVEERRKSKIKTKTNLAKPLSETHNRFNKMEFKFDLKSLTPPNYHQVINMFMEIQKLKKENELLKQNENDSEIVLLKQRNLSLEKRKDEYKKMLRKLEHELKKEQQRRINLANDQWNCMMQLSKKLKEIQPINDKKRALDEVDGCNKKRLKIDLTLIK
jgi:hypothetical protein